MYLICCQKLINSASTKQKTLLVTNPKVTEFKFFSPPKLNKAWVDRTWQIFARICLHCGGNLSSRAFP